VSAADIFALFDSIFRVHRPIKYSAPQMGENQGPMIDAGYKAPPPYNAWRAWKPL
jgi:hypothetical protein